MMKRYIFTLTLLMVGILNAFSGEEEIRFRLLPLEGDDVEIEAASAFDTKIRQALNRTSSLSESETVTYAVRPTLLIGETTATEGMVQDINRVKGELTLQAVNLASGTVYYAITVPLSATVTGSGNDAVRKLATSLKSTDPAYVRFVRNARKKIIELDFIVVEDSQPEVETSSIEEPSPVTPSEE